MTSSATKIPHLSRALSDLRNSSACQQRQTGIFPTCAAWRSRHRPASSTTSHSSSKKRLLPQSSTPNRRAGPLGRSLPPIPSASTPTPTPAPTPGPSKIDGDPASKKRFHRYLIVSLAFGSFFAFYITYVGTSWTNDIKKHAQEKGLLLQDADVSDRWKQLGRNYDDEVEFSEKIIGTNMKRKRRGLMAHAYGQVLEVSAGTGRNFPYYDLTPFDPTRPMARNIISSLTVNDQSSVMLGIAEDKLATEQARAHRPFRGPVEFVVGDAGIRGVIQRPPGGYDTIVETMGLCSMVDPVGCLRTLGTLCRQPGEVSPGTQLQAGEDDGKGGQILLLEHGRSNWDLVNKVLDSGASMHADHYGCWWNKDIGRIIQQSGLEIEQVRRYHFGTTWEIYLRPRSGRCQ